MLLHFSFHLCSILPACLLCYHHPLSLFVSIPFMFIMVPCIVHSVPFSIFIHYIHIQFKIGIFIPVSYLHFTPSLSFQSQASH